MTGAAGPQFGKAATPALIPQMERNEMTGGSLYLDVWCDVISAVTEFMVRWLVALIPQMERNERTDGSLYLDVWWQSEMK
jgi:hypothetical protein